MKYPLIGMLCLSILAVGGCQSYPKHPVYPNLTKRVPINHAVPTELQPYELPPKVQYMDAKQTVPKTIIVATPVIAPVVSVPAVIETPSVDESNDNNQTIVPVVPVVTPIVAVSPVSTVAPVMPTIEDNTHAK